MADSVKEGVTKLIEKQSGIYNSKPNQDDKEKEKEEIVDDLNEKIEKILEEIQDILKEIQNNK